ncbi:hypothetical protein [Nonomuraea solani]|uniref:hypothetical protein n=1 Tax=Nonomuraea solani TaxID=1144553 RepID=UPI0011B08B11|nr:hypothetical protein [Nonomuraea solani]
MVIDAEPVRQRGAEPQRGKHHRWAGAREEQVAGGPTRAGEGRIEDLWTLVEAGHVEAAEHLAGLLAEQGRTDDVRALADVGAPYAAQRRSRCSVTKARRRLQNASSNSGCAERRRGTVVISGSYAVLVPALNVRKSPPSPRLAHEDQHTTGTDSARHRRPAPLLGRRRHRRQGRQAYGMVLTAPQGDWSEGRSHSKRKLRCAAPVANGSSARDGLERSGESACAVAAAGQLTRGPTEEALQQAKLLHAASGRTAKLVEELAALPVESADRASWR